MKVLVKLNAFGGKSVLVELADGSLEEEIWELLCAGEYSRAASVALSRGKFLKELDGDPHEDTDAQAILTETNVHYDLT